MSEPADALSGGATTVADATQEAFSRRARNITNEHSDIFDVGNSFFTLPWVAAPSSTEGRDGLGPTFNANACAACHFKDGRGAPPTMPDEPMVGLLLRLSVPGTDAVGGPLDEPAYGGQFNHRSVLGVSAEGETRVEYVEEEGTFTDGTTYSLRRPTYTFMNLAYGPMPASILVSPRVANGVFGLGLLEALAESEILSRADEDDVDGDGISGRPNYVWDVRRGELVLGRFGWKANQPTIEQQSAGAFLGDMGITSSLFTDENCTSAQTDCANAETGGMPELDESKLAAVVTYLRLLAVPARRNLTDATALHGEELFRQAGCEGCHTETMQTASIDGFEELSAQTIHAYTDLLLHDMGEDLSDHRPDFDARGEEWRTPPLWGLGLIETVNDHEMLLHDGRARGIEEAILWHGGEALASRDAFRNMSAADREALLTFLRSL